MDYSSKFLTLALLLIFVSSQALAANYPVGGSSEWDQSVKYDSWASSKTFKVGDTLEFKYSSMHSVVELPDEASYKSCDTSNPVNSPYTSGDDKIKLDSTGTRYFACGTFGHCGQGMKVKIETVAAGGSSSSTTTPTTTTPPSSPGTSPSTASASSGQVRFIGFFALVASLVLSLI